MSFLLAQRCAFLAQVFDGNFGGRKDPSGWPSCLAFPAFEFARHGLANSGGYVK